MRIAVGSDHAGFHLKEHVKEALAARATRSSTSGPTRRARSTTRASPQAARLVADGDVDRAVLACGSGVGVAIVANKVAGVRAVNAHDPSEAEMSRRHNDVNVVTLSGARLGPSQADAIVGAFLRTEFEGGRHARRVGQIARPRVGAARDVATVPVGRRRTVADVAPPLDLLSPAYSHRPPRSRLAPLGRFALPHGRRATVADVATGA